MLRNFWIAAIVLAGTLAIQEDPRTALENCWRLEDLWARHLKWCANPKLGHGW